MLVNGMVPRSKETHAIHGLMVQDAIRVAEQDNHTDENIDYSTWEPTPMSDVQQLSLSFQRKSWQLLA